MPSEIPAPVGDAVLTEAEAQTLHAARLVLNELEGRAKAAGFESGPHKAVRHGAYAEAVEHADDALFRVLNIGATYLDSRIARRAINAWNNGRTSVDG